jgi:hypothetical protein
VSNLKRLPYLDLQHQYWNYKANKCATYKPFKNENQSSLIYFQLLILKTGKIEKEILKDKKPKLILSYLSLVVNGYRHNNFKLVYHVD